jgi:Uma2 family endonuclease
MSPSFNHSYLQARLAALLSSVAQYTVLSELSIEIDGKEYRPDICLYPARKVDFLHDISRMKELPALAVEILSLSQTVQEATDKFEVYLAAGIQSCWLVMPLPRSITLFRPDAGGIITETFVKGEMVDPALHLSLSLDALF